MTEVPGGTWRELQRVCRCHQDHTESTRVTLGRSGMLQQDEVQAQGELAGWQARETGGAHRKCEIPDKRTSVRRIDSYAIKCDDIALDLPRRIDI